jgi:GMP synthase-like glutamine amidotransferase
VRVTVIADRGDDDMGFVGERLEAAGARFERFHREDPPDTGNVIVNADVVVLFGSDRSVHDGAERSIVAREQGLVRACHAAALPLFAICYGAQIVASALGAEVAPSPAPEIGWVTLASDEPELIEPGPWFQFHYDRFGVVPGVAELARSAAAPQAFVHGRTLAVQFHPEVTARTAAHWVRSGARRIESLGLDPDAIIAESSAREAEARIRCFVLVDRFLSEVAVRPPLPAH